MTRLLHSLCLLLVFFSSIVLGRDIQPDKSSVLAGHYYLEGGPNEVASELLLKNSGEFEWVLMYGAADYIAKGTWQLTGKRLVLTTTPSPEPIFRMFGDKDYSHTSPAERGRWIAVVGCTNVGPLADIEVRFEAHSGKAATAISKPNGDAIVEMPSTEVWTRTGLRRVGSNAAWQWFDVEPKRAQARLVGFELTNLAAIKHSPFATLTLQVKPNQLVIGKGLDGLHGTYAKH